MLRKTTARILAFAAIVALTAAGCSSSHKATTSGSGSSQTTVPTSGSPVTIGFMDIEGSLGINFGPQRVEAQQLVSYLNSTGGIGGHPINLVYCVTQASTGGATCANQFVQDKAVLVLGYSLIDVASIYPILKSAGIPFFGGGTNPDQANDLTPDGNHWFTSGGALAQFAVENTVLATTLHAKTVGLLVGTSAPAQQAAQNFIQKPLEALGVKVSTVTINESNPDYTAAIDQIMNSDAMEVLTGCATSDTAIKQAVALGYKGKVFGCATPTDETAMGSAAYHGLYALVGNPIPTSATADGKLYLTLAQKYGWTSQGQTDVGVYEQVMAGIAFIKNAGGATATGTDVRNAIMNSTNLQVPLAPPAGLTCSKILAPTAPTSCNIQAMLAQVNSSGALTPVTGEWVTPS